LSTLPNSAVLFPDWKQEVNRRVAAHMSGKGQSRGASEAPAHNQPAPGSRAAKAAARVAARYANVPSYSEMLTREARAAVDAAKAAATAAEEAQAAFQYVLDGLEGAAPREDEWKLEPLPESNSGRRAVPAEAPTRHRNPPLTHPAPTIHESITGELAMEEPTSAFSWDLEAGIQQEERAGWDVAFRSAAPAINGLKGGEVDGGDVDGGEGGENVEPIYANLIEFPRPMVAARRARPRRAEGPLAAEGSRPQLSIFEVDPSAISTAPPAASVDPLAPPEWMRTEWPALTEEALPESGSFETRLPIVDRGVMVVEMDRGATLDLDALPGGEFAADDEPVPQPAPAIEAAPLSRRLLVVVVDGALIVAALVAAALVAAPHASKLPGAHVAEFVAALALAAAGFAYHACFLTLARRTPGMMYAQLEIDTFSGLVATRGQRWRRMMAMLVSVLPMGLGFVWALFDDDGFAWHDRLSGTYLRKR
jgi:uncharacterized RDD family membrane protein YckC